jgi:hypothetical protein
VGRHNRRLPFSLLGQSNMKYVMLPVPAFAQHSMTFALLIVFIFCVMKSILRCGNLLLTEDMWHTESGIFPAFLLPTRGSLTAFCPRNCQYSCRDAWNEKKHLKHFYDKNRGRTPKRILKLPETYIITALIYMVKMCEGWRHCTVFSELQS